MFHRALVRGGVNLHYSQGFNPRPKLSLPLPRSVGVQSDEELLCVSLSETANNLEPDRLKDQMSSQLTHGCEIIEVDIKKGKVSFQPVSAEYVFDLSNLANVEDTKICIDIIRKAAAAEKPIIVERQSGNKKPNRRIDVCPYIDSIKYQNRGVIVRCNITPAGSVRVDEILTLLKIEPAMLSGPVKRRAVQWRQN